MLLSATCEKNSDCAWPPKTLAAPSIRLPVLESNRGLLRLLRAAELAAWEEAKGQRDENWQMEAVDTQSLSCFERAGCNVNPARAFYSVNDK